MRQRLAAWEWIAFGVVCALGSALHFLYDLSGENTLLAAFSAVNESTWEHMKIFFFPYVLFAVAEFFALRKGYPNLLAAKALGLSTGLLLIPAVFYTARGIVGTTEDWFNISIFFLAAAVSQFVSCRMTRKGKFSSPFWQLLALVFFLLLGAAFVYFSYVPPRIPLFADPVTGDFGR